MKYHHSFRAPLLVPMSVLILFLAILPVAVVWADEVDYALCVERLNQEVQVYQGVAYFSLAWTFVTVILSLACFAKQFVRNPKFAYKFYFCMASIKLLLGILLFTVFWPSCPSGCGNGSFCQVDTHFYLYPIIVMLIGLSWILRGCKYYKIHQVQAAAAREASFSHGGDEDDGEEEGEATHTVAMTMNPQGKLSKASATKNEGIV